MHFKLAFGNQEKTGSTIIMNSVNVSQCSNMNYNTAKVLSKHN